MLQKQPTYYFDDLMGNVLAGLLLLFFVFIR